MATAATAKGAFNKALVFEGGNQYETVRPFFGFPAWWRRFMFTVLTPRDFMVYAYVCSQTDQYGIAYPTYANIKADLNISNARVIKQSLDRLESYGFLRIKNFAPLRTNKHPRNVYQRPCAEFTLRVLLQNGLIDEDLRPKRRADAARRHDRMNRDSQVIYGGLRRLFSDPAWSRIQSSLPKEKASMLMRELQYIVDEKRIRWETEEAPMISDADRAAAEDDLEQRDDGFPDAPENEVPESAAWPDEDSPF